MLRVNAKDLLTFTVDVLRRRGLKLHFGRRRGQQSNSRRRSGVYAVMRVVGVVETAERGVDFRLSESMMFPRTLLLLPPLNTAE